jgi:HemY protein
MYRIILFLLLIALAAGGAAWVADQPGDVVMSWNGWRIATSVPVFALAIGVTVVAAMLAWSILRGLWRAPGKIRQRQRERRHARGRHAITQGLLAIGHGDAATARAHANVARRHAAHDPLALLLHAQSAQLDGNREGARAAFRAMAEREDTRLLGLRGLFIEAQRADDAIAAVTIAEEALKLAPASTWASHAVLGYRCARSDWDGALAILDNNRDAGLIDKATWRRQRGVLLTARALELEKIDRDRSRECAMEAVKLAPTLVPAAVLASKYQTEAHQTRRSMRIVETAWLANPHPDLADAYAHVRLGDSARQRLVRVETLAAKMPGHFEGALAIARAAIDASEFARAREALAPLIADPTQRVAMLMAEIERTEHGDAGRARAWTLRAVRARHDPVWTADGYISDRWRPVSPVSGRLDAFQWQTPLAALPSSDGSAAIEAKEFNDAMSAPRRVEPPREPPAEAAPAAEVTPPAEVASPVEAMPPAPVTPSVQVTPPPAAAPPAAVAPLAAQDNVPADVPAPAAIVAPSPTVEPAPAPTAVPPPSAEPPAVAAPPLFRARADLPRDRLRDSPKAMSPAIPAVIPIIRAPDDPGIDDEALSDEFGEQLHPSHGQAGGWRGFLSRWSN